MDKRDAKVIVSDLKGLNTDIEAINTRLSEQGDPLKLINSDGSLNRDAMRVFLTSPKYKLYRDQHPEFVRQVSTNDRIMQNLANTSLARDAAQLGIAAGQIASGLNIDRTPPMYPEGVGRSEELQRALSFQQGIAETGITPEQRAAATNQLEKAFRSDVGNTASISGGNAATAQAFYQLAANRRDENLSRVNQMAFERRGAEATRLGGLLNQQAREDDRINRYRVQRFRSDINPRFQARMADRARLLDAGISNLSYGVNSGLTSLDNLSKQFRGDLPGYVTPNPVAGSQDDPLSTIYNGPLSRMQTNMPQSYDDWLQTTGGPLVNDLPAPAPNPRTMPKNSNYWQ